MSKAQSGQFNFHEFTDAGDPLVGGRVYTYAAGTTTQKVAYTDKAGLVSHTYTSDGIGGLYIALDSRGELPAPLFLSTGGYDIKLCRADGSTVWTRNADPSDTALRDDLASTAAGLGAALVGAESGDTVQAQIRGELLASDLVGDGTTDNTTKFGTWLTRAKAGNCVLVLPAGSFVFSDTLTMDAPIEIRGSGRDKTFLIFNNAVAGKTALKFIRNSRRSTVSKLTLMDGTFGTSTGIELIDSLGGAGVHVQKLTFIDLEIDGFALGHKYTSANPLSGGTHAMCSETLWLHCRFAINVVSGRNENCQAYNNRYIGCDFENFDTTYRGTTVVDSFDIFHDKAGGGFFFEGGSIVGRGKVYKWEYPAGGSVLWSGATFTMQNVRIEARSVHNGVLINEEVHGVTGSLVLNLDIKNIDVTAFSQNLDFLRYGGRLNGRIENVFPTAGTGTLTVRQYPTLGRTSNTNTASQGGVELVDHSLFRVVETTSPYGTWAASATGRLTSHGGRSASTNSSMTVDSVGWFSLTGPGDAQQLGMQLNGLTSSSKLLWNNDLVTSGVASDVKIVLPKGGRPLKLIAFKHATQFASNVGFLLYLVKDQANWVVPGTFAVATDALLVASMPSTAGAAGYYEIPCVLTANSLGNEIRSGFGSWTEGRMLFQKVGGATLFGGWFGVEYL